MVKNTLSSIYKHYENYLKKSPIDADNILN